MITEGLKYTFCFKIIYLLINTSIFARATEFPGFYVTKDNELTYGYKPVNFSLADFIDTEVTFHLFSKNSTEGVYLTEIDEDSDINTDIPTKFIIHGRAENDTVDWVNTIKKEYLTKGDYNVILVDWSKPASRDFFNISAANTKPVGFAIADVIINFKFNLTKVHLIGYSLGSHVAGFAGKKVFNETGSKIERITAADPARVQFEHYKVGLDSRLSRFDALIVDVIHTDIGHYGFVNPIGTVDFYFNGGKHQAGCPPVDDICNHVRSALYFAESIKSNNFGAVQCSFSENPFENKIIPIFTTIFGENLNKDESGIYCLSTNGKSPFALGAIDPIWDPLF